MSSSTHSDPRPPSAVSSGTGWAGLAGLGAWILVARHFGLAGPNAAMAAVIACGLPMVLWSLLVDRVHRNPTTGIDWDGPPRPLSETLDTSLTKIVGYWVTWGGIALFYGLGRWYWTEAYGYTMTLLGYAVPVLLAGSIPYVLWLDRRLADPRDNAHAFGQFVLNVGRPDRKAVIEHLRSWAVKGFFTAFMISIVPGNFYAVATPALETVLADPVRLAQWLIGLLFLIDVAFATVGYVLTMRPLDAHIRSANPYAAGWVAALVCYPPFILMGNGGPLDYHPGTAEWFVWLDGHPLLKIVTGALLVLLTAIYAWATVAFGLRFSNLTHRGILTHGPYRWTRHPAYLSKNLFWWLASMPFLSVNGDITEIIRNCAILAAINGIYYWRARTEERHLLADPAYAAYHAWAGRNAPVPRFFGWLTGNR